MPLSVVCNHLPTVFNRLLGNPSAEVLCTKRHGYITITRAFDERNCISCTPDVMVIPP
jgi:hypothetical protein